MLLLRNKLRGNVLKRGTVVTPEIPSIPLPLTVPGLFVWLKADAGIVLDSSSGVATVSQWQDQSGSGNNAIQTTKTRQPKVITSALGSNHKTLEFLGNANGKYMILDVTKPVKTSFIVWRSTADFNDYNGILSARAATSGKPEGTVASAVGYSIQGNGSGRVINIYTADQTAMTEIRFNGIEQNTETARNYKPGILPVGTPYSFNTITARYSADPGGFRRFFIGTEPLYSRYLQGEISEILLYETDLSQADILKVEDYLKTKYGHY